jgi:hypothetical protein
LFFLKITRNPQQEGSHEAAKTVSPRETRPAPQPNAGHVEQDTNKPEQHKHQAVARSAVPAANRGGKPMVSLRKFGRKVRLPSTVEIKHQLLVRWLADQTAKEAAEASTLALVPAPQSADRSIMRAP